MSRTTRERRRSNPVSVRFADTPVLVQYVGSPPSYPLRRVRIFFQNLKIMHPQCLKIFSKISQIYEQICTICLLKFQYFEMF
jgi:hypothetical protein